MNRAVISQLVFFLLVSCSSKIDLSWLEKNNTTSDYKDFLSKSEIDVPVYPVTKGPKRHWFAYYDKYQTDPTDRYVLSMQVDFEHRSPTPDDEIRIGMIDLAKGGKWIELGNSRAWNWQQGCMLQWRPGRDEEVLWNDRVDGRFVCHILNVRTMEKRTIPTPVYTVSPDGKYALTLDFERVQDVRAGYGYAGIPDKNKNILAPEHAGIYRVSLDDGNRKLIVSLKDIAGIPYPPEDLTPYKHYFNAIEISPDGNRFAFLHRWVVAGEAARISPLGTRFITASVDGEDVHIINDSRMTSHFWWKNSEQILAWANRPEVGNRFYLFEDKAQRSYQVIGEDVLKVDGHCSYLPNKDWIMNDTYPDKNRQVELYLYNTVTAEKVVLGRFYIDPRYTGEWRVDLHPRQSRDGKKIIIDCPVGDSGRQMLMLDISGLRLQPWIDSDTLVAQTLRIDARERSRLMELETAGVSIVRPVALPRGRYLRGENKHLGWPVGIKVGGTLLCAYHQTLRHHGAGSRQDDGSSDAVVVRSTDGGQTWSDPIDMCQFGVSDKPMVLNFGNCFGVLEGKVLLATRYGLYCSKDEGATWRLMPGALTREQTGHDYSDNFGPRMVVHPDKGLVIPVGVERLPVIDLYASNDEGVTWAHERWPLSDSIHPLEPTAMFQDGRLIFLSRNHTLPFKWHQQLDATQRPCMMVSETGWFPIKHQGITNISSFRWPDTSDLDYNPHTKRFEAVVTNRSGGAGDNEQNEQQEQTVNLWSISREDLYAGESHGWRFEATLLRLESGMLEIGPDNIDAAHPGGAVMDKENGVQHIFIYCGKYATPTGVYRITRTLDTPKLVKAMIEISNS